MVNSKGMHRKLWICPLAALTTLAWVQVRKTQMIRVVTPEHPIAKVVSDFTNPLEWLGVMRRVNRLVA